jgi:hypothetical protein
MSVFVGRIIEKITDKGFPNEKYKIKKLKTISGNVHAVIVKIDDENSEMLVAISILQDKTKFKSLK